jgi:error-prone DNA polymerase
MNAYVELHCHSNFSLLDGASHPEDLVARAADLGMDTLALTDHDAVYGAVRFVEACRQQGIKPILGAEVTLTDGHHLTLLVENATGWHNLCELLTLARHNAPKGEALLPIDRLAPHTGGLIALSGCRHGEIAGALLRGNRKAAIRAAVRYRELFGPESFWIELQHHLLPDDPALIDELVSLARHLGLGIVATNDVHYAEQDGHRLQDVLTCIRHNLSLDAAAQLVRPNSEFYLKSAGEMARLFADHPRAIANTRLIADRCTFELRYGLQDLPTFDVPDGMTAQSHLRALCAAALPGHYGTPSPDVLDRLELELGIIERASMANYFLIVWDLVRFARDRGIRCQGRGSAANSIVAYLLGITPIEPLAQRLVFERFLSDERRLMPDIDIDFDAARREEVIQYLYQRYGHAHTAMACTFVTYRTRSAIRDVGKALGFPLDLLDHVAKTTDTRSAETLAEQYGDVGQSLPWQQLLDLTAQIRGFPRHLGIHNGGMVITGSPLSRRVPTEPATMPDRFVIQWDKDALETVGLVKIDVLGLRMLSLIADAVEIVRETTGQAPDLERLIYDDPAVYAQVTDADTVGVFQVESRAQVQVLPRLQPTTFDDLIVSISLIRPGPLQGNMVHPYLRRRFGEEPVTYPHPSLEAALTETLGVILFQEQVLKVAHDLAGLTPGQGELLRRALGSKYSTAGIEALRDVFLRGAYSRGVPAEVAEEVFAKLQAFGSYSFPKSHAAAFAVLVYQSAWLKHYHPLAFYVGLLNNQPMGFWSPEVVVNDAKRHDIAILPVDVTCSRARCIVESGAIRLGFNYVSGIGEARGEGIEAARDTGPFRHLGDFCRRTQLPRRAVENLIRVGAMDAWDIPRRQLLWDLGKLQYRANELELDYPDDDVDLEPLSDTAMLLEEYEVLGLSTGAHVMSLFREQLRQRGCLTSRDLEHCSEGTVVEMAGQLTMHQAPPTAKGFHFLTLEDEWGMMNAIVKPDVYSVYREVIRSEPILVVKGVVQRRERVINLVVKSFGKIR